MTIDQQDLAALQRCCLGNQEAMEWLIMWNNYVHLIDDIVDEDLDTGPKSKVQSPRSRGAERINEMGARAVMLYSHPFFLKNLPALKQVVLNCTNAYAQTVQWERSGIEWQARWADAYRHFGAEVALAVACICGGFEHMRSLTAELHTLCYFEHHDHNGEPI